MKGTGNPQIIVYTGDGKGKTCAAFGQLVRALGHDGKCAVASFIKADPRTLDCGEWKALQDKVLWKSFGAGFTWVEGNDEKDKELAIQGWEQVKRWISAACFDMLVLDEFTYILSRNYVDVKQVCQWLDDHHGKKGFPNIVISGRNCPDELISIADIVSEITEIKHSSNQKQRKPLPMIEF